MAEQEAFPSLAQPVQEPCVAALSVGPCTLHPAGRSEEDRVPPVLEWWEPVHKAAQAGPSSPPRCSVPGDRPVLVMPGTVPEGR